MADDHMSISSSSTTSENVAMQGGGSTAAQSVSLRESSIAVELGLGGSKQGPSEKTAELGAYAEGREHHSVSFFCVTFASFHSRGIGQLLEKEWLFFVTVQLPSIKQFPSGYEWKIIGNDEVWWKKKVPCASEKEAHKLHQAFDKIFLDNGFKSSFLSEPQIGYASKNDIEPPPHIQYNGEWLFDCHICEPFVELFKIDREGREKLSEEFSRNHNKLVEDTSDLRREITDLKSRIDALEPKLAKGKASKQSNEMKAVITQRAHNRSSREEITPCARNWKPDSDKPVHSLANPEFFENGEIPEEDEPRDSEW